MHEQERQQPTSLPPWVSQRLAALRMLASWGCERMGASTRLHSVLSGPSYMRCSKFHRRKYWHIKCTLLLPSLQASCEASAPLTQA